MPSIEEIELGRHLVPCARGHPFFGAHVVAHFSAGILGNSSASSRGPCVAQSDQGPRGIAPVEVDDGPHIVDQDDVNVEPAGDQSGRLEEIIVVLGPGLRLLLRSQALVRLVESTVLVDVGKLIGNVIVESIEHDHDTGDTRREAMKTLLGEAVWLELAVLVQSDSIEFLV
jgi:hypothetical protein